MSYQYQGSANILALKKWEDSHWAPLITATLKGDESTIASIMQTKLMPIYNDTIIGTIIIDQKIPIDRKLKIIDLLLKKGADPNVQAKLFADHPNTPLWMFAAIEGQTEVLQILLPYIKDINVLDSDRATVLKRMFEGVIGNKAVSADTLALLLKNKLDPTIPSAYGWGEELFWKEIFWELAFKPEYQEILVSLLKKVNINEVDDFGTIFHQLVNMPEVSQKNKLSLIRLLLSHHADPSIPNKYGQTPLMLAVASGYTDIVNEFKTIKTEEHEFTRRVRKAKEVGHILGVNSIIDTDDYGKNTSTINIPFEGKLVAVDIEHWEVAESAALFEQVINSYLINYLQQKRDPIFDQERVRYTEILDAARAEVAYLNSREPREIAVLQLMQRYQNNKITILPCKWGDWSEGHAVSIAIYKDYLVYCNRLDPLAGTRVYKLKHPINSDWIRRLYPGGKTLNKEVIEAIISEVVDLQNPITRLDAKVQRHQTCTFVNRKSVTEGINYVLEREKLERAGLPPREAHIQAKNYAQDSYKHFTMGMRNLEIDKLLHELRSLPAGADMDRKLYNDLLKEYLLAHYGKESPKDSRTPDKEGIMFIRAKIILNALDPVTQQAIFKALPKLEKAFAEGEELDKSMSAAGGRLNLNKRKKPDEEDEDALKPRRGTSPHRSKP